MADDLRNGQPIRMAAEQADKYRKLAEYIKSVIQSGFTGHIKVSYAKGSVLKVEKFEEVLKK
jgi:hypothetical protein